MPSIHELSQAIEAYRRGQMSIDQFEDRYRENSIGMFAEDAPALQAHLAVESAFSQVRFGEATEEEFAAALEHAISPWLQRGVRTGYWETDAESSPKPKKRH